MTHVDWIAVDWGSTNLRVWAMSADGDIVHKAACDKGLLSLKPDAFEPALLSVIDPWLSANVTPVIACGMVGARQGWVEATYQQVPCAIDPTLVSAPTKDPRIAVHVVAGAMQPTPADVMRGEETQISGVLADDPEFDGVICLPGTHSKWARVSAGELCHFQTFMTGEIFGLLSKSSILSHSIAADGWDVDAFDEAVETALDRPQLAYAKLFELRAGALVGGLTGKTARARLSGLLIGLELAGAKPYWLGMPVTLVGDATTCDLYQTVLVKQGIITQMRDATTVTLAGLRQAYLGLSSR